MKIEIEIEIPSFRQDCRKDQHCLVLLYLVKHDTSERFIVHLREHHEERHIIATRCMYFSWTFFLIFVWWPQQPPANTVLSPDCDGKWSENAYFLGLRRRFHRTPLTSRGGAIRRATLGVTSFDRPVYCCSPVYWLNFTTVQSILTESASAQPCKNRNTVFIWAENRYIR